MAPTCFHVSAPVSILTFERATNREAKYYGEGFCLDRPLKNFDLTAQFTARAATSQTNNVTLPKMWFFRREVGSPARKMPQKNACTVRLRFVADTAPHRNLKRLK
jgi:hypothetical protein